ncbi:MAG: ATP-binding protein [Bacteroidota bacterium]
MKIILTGPESTGKSTLAAQLAQQLEGLWVPEYARTYIQTIDRLYEEADLLRIAQEQQRQIAEKQMENPPFLFCDTSLLVIKIWSEYKYGRCHPWIEQQLKAQEVDLYLLCGIDVPWTYDEQREHPTQREELYAIYERELQQLRVPFVRIHGALPQRLKTVTDLLCCVSL